MGERTINDRVSFIETLELFECDFSKLAFTSKEQIDAFYDEVDRRLAATNRRWYFLVHYTDCTIAEEVWDHFAARGKNSNLSYGLGTVRIGAAPPVHQIIRVRSMRDRFRSNLFQTRDEALVALGEMRKRRELAGTAATEPLLRVDDIHLQFGGIRALHGVSFDIERAEIFAIIGPNGAGKSSMLNVINGFYHPQRGRITYRGQTRTQMRPYEAAKQGIARTFQNLALFKGMSTLDNIMAGRLLKMRSNVLLDALYLGPARREEFKHREHVEHIIDFLEIQAIRKTPVGRLPYGLQKRVDLGRALAAEPELLLLDEPMAGMNVEEKEDMCRFVLDVHDEFGTTIALIEHDMGVVMDISDRVVVLDHGVKIAEGTPDEVRKDQAVIGAYLGVAYA